MTTRTENATVRMKNDNSSNTEMSKRDANNYKESEGTEKNLFTAKKDGTQTQTDHKDTQITTDMK